MYVDLYHSHISRLTQLVICLRRRTKKKIRRATERRRSRHGTVTAGTGGGAVVTSLDTKPVENVDEKPKPVSRVWWVGSI